MSAGSNLTPRLKLSLAALMLWTLGVTVARAARGPNDFAEAHWLLDYRFGFVKRGLVGTCVTLMTSALQRPVTEGLIFGLAVTLFAVFCLLLVFLCLRVLSRSAWSAHTGVLPLVFLSSPFLVMSAHLVGYYDNMIVILAAVSVALIIGDRIRLAAAVQAVAVLVHESALVIAFPVFLLAWLLANAQRRRQARPALGVLPLLLPIAAFFAMAPAQAFLLTPDFKDAFATRLRGFPFVQNARETAVPLWLASTFLENFGRQYQAFPHRLFAVQFWGPVLPSTTVIVLHILDEYRVRLLTVEGMVLSGVVFAPQLLHSVAWDTHRIWTYSILTAFLALWAYAELATPEGSTSAGSSLGLPVLITNAAVITPLLDRQSDHLSLTLRMCLYAPVILGAVALVARGDRLGGSERLWVRGIGLRALLSHSAKTSPGRDRPQD